MTGPEVFLKIGSFLPSAVIVSVGMMFAGLYEWVKASWILDDAPTGTSEKKANTKQKWIRRRKPVLQALGVVISTHVVGLLLFSMITSSFFSKNQQVGFCFLPCLRALQLTALSWDTVSPVSSSDIESSTDCSNSTTHTTTHQRCAFVCTFEGSQPLLRLNCHINNDSSELFTRCNHCRPPRPSFNSREPIFLRDFCAGKSVCQILDLCCSWALLDCMGTARDRKGYLELGGSWGMVCTVHMYSLRSAGTASWDSYSLTTVTMVCILNRHRHTYHIYHLYTNTVSPYIIWVQVGSSGSGRPAKHQHSKQSYVRLWRWESKYPREQLTCNVTVSRSVAFANLKIDYHASQSACPLPYYPLLVKTQNHESL